MALTIEPTNVVVQAQFGEQAERKREDDKPNSVFGFSSSIPKEDMALLGGITAAGLIGLAIIGRKNISGLFMKTKFKTLEQAREFGKTKIIKALKKKEPYEYMVVIDKDTNTIVAQAKGKSHHVVVNASDIIKPTCHFSIEHGHPTDCIINGKPAAGPLSFSDYRSGIWSNGAEDVIAYDVNGKFSMISRKPDFKKLSANELGYYCNIYNKLNNDTYLKIMLKYLPEEFQSVTSGQRLIEMYYSLKRNGQLSKDLDKNFHQAFEAIKTCPTELLYKYDRFWKTYADDLGVVYKSNFEYLKTPQAGNYAKMSDRDFARMILEDESLSLDLILKVSKYILSKGNIKALKEAYFKGDFKTIEKLCQEHAKIVAAASGTASPVGKMTRIEFIKYMNKKLGKADKINVNSLPDAEVCKLAKLLGTTEEKIRKMDKQEYRRLCFRTHPDTNRDDNMAQEVFTILQHLAVV